MGAGRVAERQCVACRDRDAAQDLIRLVVDPEGEVAVDLRGRLPGRGAWIHPAKECVDRAVKRPESLSRALKRSVRAVDLEDRLRESVVLALRDGLSLAAAAGGLVGGKDQLVAALKGKQVVEVCLAKDASPRFLQEVQAAAADIPFTELPLDRQELGVQIGAGLRAAVGVLSTDACVHLRRQLQRLRRLG